MIKVKHTVTTKSIYSIEGKSFQIEYEEKDKNTMCNLAGYAMKDTQRGEMYPFDVSVMEDGSGFNFKIPDEETKKAYIEIFKKMQEDLK